MEFNEPLTTKPRTQHHSCGAGTTCAPSRERALTIPCTIHVAPCARETGKATPSRVKGRWKCSQVRPSVDSKWGSCVRTCVPQRSMHGARARSHPTVSQTPPPRPFTIPSPLPSQPIDGMKTPASCGWHIPSDRKRRARPTQLSPSCAPGSPGSLRSTQLSLHLALSLLTRLAPHTASLLTPPRTRPALEARERCTTLQRTRTRRRKTA